MLSIKDLVRIAIVRMRWCYFVKVRKMDIAPSAFVSVGTKLDKVHPKGIHVGEDTYIASGTRILTHDYCKRQYGHTRIGKCCFIGTDALLLCGVTLGDHVIVGGGAVVTKDVPANTIVAGNPAHIIRKGIMTTKYGQLVECK